MFVLLQSAAFGGVFTGFGIARDFESGFARRLLLAAPRRSGIVLGYALAALVRWLIDRLGAHRRRPARGDGGAAAAPVDLFGLYALALLVNVAGDCCGLRRRDAAAHDAGRAR